MDKKSFLASGHLPTLFSAFLYFDVSFMVWVLFGPVTPFIAEQLHLSATQKGLLTAIPLLGGSFFRPIMGLLADRIGGRRAGLTGLTLTLIPLVLGWRYATELWQFYLIGFLLGIAGASFAVALPLAGRWYSSEHQGLAMGIAGAGNSGTLIATFFAPRLAQHFGWHSVFGLALIPISMALAAFFVMARNSPAASAPKPWAQYARVLRQADTWRLCFLYSITFGGFVGLSSFLSVFFHDQYHLSKVQAGDYATVVILSGSFLRPVGGWIADKIGGYRLLLILFAGVSISLMAISSLPPVAVVVPVLFLGMGMLGMGNGAVFQIAPQRFPADIELTTGIVGAAGGLGGFFLPSAIGALKDAFGSYGYGVFAFAMLVIAGAFLLLEFGVRWARSWNPSALSRTMVFSYRGPRALAAQERPLGGEFQPAED
ncbi:NarK/NasA family nitrate transporter [Acidobacteria bacterium AB60]|nr:NarK/NasA family nitrate transporter [Acidobacteria bacterium AB60]